MRGDSQTVQPPAGSDDFVVPDWQKPLDVEGYLACIPEEAITKGVFFKPLRQRLRERGNPVPGRDHYLPFHDYPMREYMEVVLECSALLYPEKLPRQRLRDIGRLVYPTFAETLLGRVLFKFAGNNIPLVLSAVPRAYKRVDPSSSAAVATLEDDRAVLEIRNMWDVPEATQVGVYEGGLQALGLNGEVKVRPRSLCDCDLEIRWSPAR